MTGGTLDKIFGGGFTKFKEELEQYAFYQGVHVTHFTRTIPEEGVYIPLGFVTQVDGDGTHFGDEIYFFGYDFPFPKPKSQIENSEQRGNIIKLKERIWVKDRSKTLWMSPTKEVYLTDKENPINYPEKVRVA